MNVTAKEIAKIMDMLKIAYPEFYKYQTISDEKKAITLWSEMFKNEEADLVIAAIKSFIESDEKGYPPHIGAIKSKIRLLTGKEEMTEQEAWGIVARALRNSSYGYKEEFEKFPHIIKRLVSSPEQLKEWGMMDYDTVHSVIASNFQRSYRNIIAREKEIKKLPKDVLSAVKNLKMISDEKIPENQPEIPPEEKEDFPVCKPTDEFKRALQGIKAPIKRVEKNPENKKRSREEVLAILRGE